MTSSGVEGATSEELTIAKIHQIKRHGNFDYNLQLGRRQSFFTFEICYIKVTYRLGNFAIVLWTSPGRWVTWRNRKNCEMEGVHHTIWVEGIQQNSHNPSDCRSCWRTDC